MCTNFFSCIVVKWWKSTIKNPNPKFYANGIGRMCIDFSWNIRAWREQISTKIHLYFCFSYRRIIEANILVIFVLFMNAPNTIDRKLHVVTSQLYQNIQKFKFQFPLKRWFNYKSASPKRFKRLLLEFEMTSYVNYLCVYYKTVCRFNNVCGLQHVSNKLYRHIIRKKKSMKRHCRLWISFPMRPLRLYTFSETTIAPGLKRILILIINAIF